MKEPCEHPEITDRGLICWGDGPGSCHYVVGPMNQQIWGIKFLRLTWVHRLVRPEEH